MAAESAIVPDGTSGTVAGNGSRHVRQDRSAARARLIKGCTSAVLLALGAGAWWWVSTHHFAGGGHGEVSPAAGTAAAAPPADTVTLPAGDVASRIVLVTAEPRLLREHLTVPGRLDYDARFRVDYQSPVDGIVSRVSVAVRQRVAKGDSLAEVSSPDVGNARDDVRRREADRQIERKAAEWAATIATNVENLLTSLQGRPPLERIEDEFKDRVLGSYRERILGAYSRLLYVEKVNAGTRQLGEGGVLSGRIVEERTSNLEVAKASFTAACEEALFQTRQDRDKAQATFDQAERLVQVAREHLRTLVGSKLEADVGSQGAAEGVADAEGDEAVGSLSTLVLRTPFAGLVEDIFVARGERVRAGDRLFVVADTSTLWVRAQIHERQWTTVEVKEGQTVAVNVPGSAEHNTTARVNHVGATIEAESRSVSLVAELENDDAHYKPGMFVWVDLPQGQERRALAVPAAAVMRHAGKSFVFVPDGAGRYRRVDIDAGPDTDGFVEVRAGLQAGGQVVGEGAFLLKSELLLEQDEEPAG